MDLVRALEESLISFYGAMTAKGIKPIIRLPEVPVWRNLDKTAVHRILSNIISNSIKYTDGDLTVRMDENGTNESGEAEMYNLFLKSWNGRPGKPEEMAYPLVITGSDVCSYLSGQVIYIDFGMTGEMDWKAATENR